MPAREPLVAASGALTIEEVQRYSRHLLIPGVGVEGQRHLKQARVACIGAGGLGAPVLMYLAAAGVGTIGIIDFDTVDTSNLQRQVIHGVDDVGRSKAQSARDSIGAINPLVEVVLHEVRLDRTNALEILGQYDLVIDGSDNFATRYLANDACVLLGKPYVWGSIYRFEGQASVFWAGHGPCYRCLYPEAPPPGMVPSCAEGGVFGVLCASIGAIQATEAIKLLTGIGELLTGRLLRYDALGLTHRTLNVARDPDCAICGTHPTVTELIDYDIFCGTVSPEAADAAADATIDARTLAEWLQQRERGERDFTLIDVREPDEVAIVRIPGAINIPKDRFLDGTAIDGLPQDRPLVLHCKSGRRSAECLAIVHSAGFADAVHLGGGVLAWVRDVEPQLPTY